MMMTMKGTVEYSRPDLRAIKGQPVRANLRPLVSEPPAERRDLASRRALLHRVHGEFREMPGLRLSIQQAARLFSVPPTVCARVLAELIADDLLRVTHDGHYALLGRAC
jgi:hypothetical protein